MDVNPNAWLLHRGIPVETRQVAKSGLARCIIGGIPHCTGFPPDQDRDRSLGWPPIQSPSIELVIRSVVRRLGRYAFSHRPRF